MVMIFALAERGYIATQRYCYYSNAMQYNIKKLR